MIFSVTGDSRSHKILLILNEIIFKILIKFSRVLLLFHFIIFSSQQYLNVKLITHAGYVISK